MFPGTRVEDAKAILAASPLRMFASDDLDQAAKMVSYSTFASGIVLPMATVFVRVS